MPHLTPGIVGFRNYSVEVAFACTAIVVTFLSDVLWKSGPGWVKDIFSGNKFVPKSQGFISFCFSAIAVSIVSIVIQQAVSNFLAQHAIAPPSLPPANNVDLFVVGFVVVTFVYWNKKIYGRQSCEA